MPVRHLASHLAPQLAPQLAPPTDIVRRAQDRLLARVSKLADAASTAVADAASTAVSETSSTAVSDADHDRGDAPILARPRVEEAQRYVFREAVASGGIGVIRRAEDVRLGRVIAVKELLRASPDAQRRFALEAAITARLQHPGIVPLYDLGWRDGGEPFYCMKLVDGQSLDAKIQQATSLPQRLRLVEHVIAVADAIAYAHAQKVLHRDLKPANVLVGSFGETVVIDWGLAKDLSGALVDEVSQETCPEEHGISDMTQAGTVLGTLRYMPPEQAAGEAVDARSDVYALGAILYHVLSGRPPFAGETGMHLAAQVLAGAVADLRRDPAIPAELATITHRAMARAPAERYPSAAAFAEDLRRFQAGRMVAAHAYSLAGRARLWARSHRVAVAASALTLVAGAMLGGQALRQAQATAVERARTEQAEREASAQADKAERIQFEREAIAGAQRLDASILRAQDMSEEADRNPEARAIAQTAVREALRTGGPVSAASKALAATLVAPRKLAELGGNDGNYVEFVDWLAGGAVIVTLGEGQLLRLWDRASGARLFELAGVAGAGVADDGSLLTDGVEGLVRRDPRTGAVTAKLGDEQRVIAMSPDRRRVAAVLGEAVVVRDVSSGEQLATLKGTAHVAAFSRDGSRIVTGGDGHAWLWSLPQGKRLADLSTPSRGYTALAINDDGTRVAVAGNDEHIHMWDARGARPRLVKRAAGPKHAAERLMFAPDGRTLVSAIMDGSWFAWDAEDGRLIRRVDGDAGHFGAADLSPDGRWLAVGAGDGTVRVWEVASGVLRATLRAEHGEVMAVMFAPDSRRILAGTLAGPTVVWELPVSVPAHWHVDMTPLAVDIEVASDRFVVAEADGVTVHRLGDGARLARLQTEGTPRVQLELSRQGVLFTAAADGVAELWDADTGARRCVLPTRVDLELQRANFITGAGADAVVTVDGDSAAHLWSTSDCRAVPSLRGGKLPYGRVQATPAGQVVIPASMEQLEVIDPWSPGGGLLLGGMKSPIGQVAFANDGSQIFALGWHGDAKSWDARTGATLAELKDHATAIVSAVYTPDDSAILTLDRGHSAWLWRAADLSPMVRFQGRRNWSGTPAVFSPDGGRVLTADLGGEVGLWDVGDGAFMGVLARLHGQTPLAMAFTADGADVVVIGSPLGAARVPATPEGLLAASER